MPACSRSTLFRAVGGSIVFGAALLLGAVVASPTVSTVQLADAEADETLAVYSLEEGETFEIRYIHSFEGTPIHETYTVEDGEIVQVREAYAYHAAGLEHSRETYRDGNMTVSELDHELGSFSVRVAGTTEQSLVIDGEQRALDSYAEPGSTIRISATERNSVTDRLLRAVGDW